ncbi:MAG: tRNA preQ1(34) S-adenosylmethionine ribosyltransferase-isomerase QueA [Burkholderiales bacterium]|nr:tRNA preQ1(34) S-adenosylmethionine ribosyltransferase-isomerase QueA [Burkholderiales bacterium]
MQLDEFDFDLPAELVALHPLPKRSASRLLHLASDGSIKDRRFSDLPELLSPDDVLVFNNTRVLKARLLGVKQSGGKIEALIERVLDRYHALAQIRASHAPRPGSSLLFGADASAKVGAAVIDRTGEFFRLRFAQPVMEVLSEHGQTPLPPYIDRVADAADEVRYQTVYASEPGAVAAPTAGLHFDAEILEKLAASDVQLVRLTLHVGAGTFQPVRVQNIAEHRMHRERYSISETVARTIVAAKAAGKRICAVGTTSLRALEASAADGSVRAGEGETDIFITPGYRFRVVDRLLTNFHLPKSTLLMLVSAFGGIDHVRSAYRHAIDHRYRFFSYGDAMLIERVEQP